MPDYDIWHIYDEMEKHLTASMARNLQRHIKEETEYGFEWEQWQAAKLREMRKFRKQNQKIIGQHTKNLPADIKQHLENEYKQGLVGIAKKHAEIFGSTKLTRDLTSGFFGMNDKRVQSLIDAVNNDLKNANHAALRAANDAYRQTIHKAAMFTANGVMTQDQAIQLAIDEFKKRGLNCIQYSNGARHNIKDYAEMAVKTAGTRSMLMGEGKARQELGETLVRISKHGTACDLCVPFESKVLIDDVYSGGTWENSKEKYEKVPASMRAHVQFMSQAMKEGLYHPRCRHGLGTFYVELLDMDLNDDTPIAIEPKAPEKTAEEIAAEQAAAKEKAAAERAKIKQSKWQELYKLNNKASLTPDDMAKITALEDDLMSGGDYDGFDEWAANKTAQLEQDYNELYELEKKLDTADFTDEEKKQYLELWDKVSADFDGKYSVEFEERYIKWAENQAILEAEARAVKIKESTEKLYKALYDGQTGPEIEALKQTILDDAEMLEAYNKLTEPLFEAAQEEYNIKRAYEKLMQDALNDAEQAEKAAKKAAKDAKEAAEKAAQDVASGWMPNYDKDYFAKYGKYPVHTDINYLANKEAWRRAKYTQGLEGDDLAAVIIKLDDSDLTNAELKRIAFEKEAADKAAELAKKKAEKKAAKQAAEQAKLEKEAAKAEFDKAKQSMLKSFDDKYSQERKNAAYWFSAERFGGSLTKAKEAADKLLRPIAGEKWRNMSTTAKRGFYEYTAGSGKFNRPLRGYDGSWYNYKGVGKVPLDNEGRNVPAMIAAMKDAYKDCTYDFDMWVQRGDDMSGAASRLGLSAQKMRNMTDAEWQDLIDIGYKVTDYGFISTGTAKGEGFGGEVITNIYAPSGTRMLYVEPMSHYGAMGSKGASWDGVSDVGYLGSEFETLIDSGYQYRLVKVERKNGRLYLDMEVVLDD